MKNFFRNSFLFLALLFASFSTHALVSPTAAYAADTNAGANTCQYLLGMPAWNCHVSEVKDIHSDEDLSKNIWTIAANIGTDLTVIAAYLVLGFVIYGGYLYIFAAGDPGKLAAGKKTLTQAFIGLAIVLSANVIMNAIRIALGANFSSNCLESGGDGCFTVDTAGTMVTTAIQWVIGIAGAIALIFVVYGAIAYITSAGDPSKVQKAKNVILYSLIGLIIVALAEIATAFVSNMIKEANQTSFTPATLAEIPQTSTSPSAAFQTQAPSFAPNSLSITNLTKESS